MAAWYELMLNYIFRHIHNIIDKIVYALCYREFGHSFSDIVLLAKLDVVNAVDKYLIDIFIAVYVCVML